MKKASIASYRLSSSGGDRNPFDAAKFGRQINSKGEFSWWQGFLQSVERKRKEIYRDLLLFSQPERVRNHN
jgi:hypothetical protein